MYKLSLFLLLTSLSLFAQDRGSQSGGRFELLSGTKKGKEIKTYWDKKYNNDEYVFGKTPAKFLSLNYNYIPAGSRVLDMGMGEGRNAVFLARKGYKVTGVDISSVAVKKARLLAREFGVRINTVVASLNNHRISKNTLDAVVCFYYVDRSLNKRMVEWLKPGGILIYESHTDNQRKVKGNESYDKRYLLREGELLSMFPGMRVLKYEEPTHLGNFTTSIILQKKKPE
jgi:tellurite methyltransferase